LAIVSLVMLVPLVAIATGAAVTESFGVVAGLIALLLVCVTVAAVNIAFNLDLLRPKD
jgi:hypothetical protein